MAAARILVINPNSNEAVTRGIDDSIDAMRQPRALVIDCVTLADAPFGIESDEDVEAASPLVVDTVEAGQDDFGAFVIACYSDPGLERCRRASRSPVLGIQESAIREASRGGRRFGVLALSDASIRRHLVYVRARGVRQHVGERALNVTVDQGVHDAATFGRIVAEGRKLVGAGAEALVLGCAGLAAHRERAAAALGVPVIDPVQAAVTEACDVLYAGV